MGRVVAAWQGLRRLVARGGLLLAAAVVAIGVWGAPASMATSREAAAPGPAAVSVSSGPAWRGSTSIERLDSVAAVSSGASVGSRSVELGGSPGVPFINPATDTLYVPITCDTTPSCPGTAPHVVDVIDAATCNATTSSHCRPIAEAQVGVSPTAVTIDAKTDTIYVANTSGSVSVVDGGRCNATATAGCAKPLATITTGGVPVALALDPETHTLYVASNAGQVFVIDVAKCNVSSTAGCGRPDKQVADTLDPAGIDVDLATNTVYAANAGLDYSGGDTVSVIDGATCDAIVGTGCNQVPPTVTVGNDSDWDVVDQATDTVYVANPGDGTVSVIDGATCNSQVQSGCSSVPPAVATGADAAFVLIDASLHTLFAMNQGDDTLSEINTATCKGGHTSGCPSRARNQAVPNPPGGYGANSFALDPDTDTAYLANEGGQSSLAMVAIGSCDATTTTGCRVEAPTVPDSEYLMTFDPATETIYATSLPKPQIDVINAATCTAGDLSGCSPVATIPVNGGVGAIDDATHTLYFADDGSDTVSVLDTATCNATETSGCGKVAATMRVGAFPRIPVINPVTQTLYVPYQTKADRIAVLNTSNCNAEVTSGCGQTPAVIDVGAGTHELVVSTKTDTVYASNSGYNVFGDTVSVINGATCDGTDHTGCGSPAAIAKVEEDPYGMALDQAAHTLYVANNRNGDSPGTLSVIDTATCNADDTSGCSAHFPTVQVGRSPLLVALDANSHKVFVGDYSSAAVSVVDAATCQAADTSGCRRHAAEQAVGSQPFGLTVDPTTDTVYATDLLGAGSLSIFKG